MFLLHFEFPFRLKASYHRPGGLAGKKVRTGRLRAF